MTVKHRWDKFHILVLHTKGNRCLTFSQGLWRFQTYEPHKDKWVPSNQRSIVGQGCLLHLSTHIWLFPPPFSLLSFFFLLFLFSFPLSLFLVFFLSNYELTKLNEQRPCFVIQRSCNAVYFLFVLVSPLPCYQSGQDILRWGIFTIWRAPKSWAIGFWVKNLNSA